MSRFALLFILAIAACSEPTASGNSAPVVLKGDKGDPGLGTKGDKGDPGQPGPKGDNCQAPPSTFTMASAWAEAEAYRYSCDLEAKMVLQTCLANDDAYKCQAAYKTDGDYCNTYYAKRINKIPLRECGVRIISVTGESGTPSFDFHVLDGDQDGDSISNYFEMLMGYNPCTPKSFGCLNDADLDYDKDGKPNGADDLPLCNPTDPGEYQTDCI